MEYWTAQPMVIVSIILTMVWQAIGYYMVMYMASMAAVPIDLYESASIDGAGYGRTMVEIIFPMAQPSNCNVDVHAYVKNGKFCVVNNTYEPQSTTVYRGDGSSFDLDLAANEIRWYEI